MNAFSFGYKAGLVYLPVLRSKVFQSFLCLIKKSNSLSLGSVLRVVNQSKEEQRGTRHFSFPAHEMDSVFLILCLFAIFFMLMQKRRREENDIPKETQIADMQRGDGYLFQYQRQGEEQDISKFKL